MKRSLPLIVIALAGACGGSDAEPGDLGVAIYGEDFAEEGIPADLFTDGWAVSFDSVLLSVGDVTAAAGHDEPALTAPAFRVWNLARPSGGAGYEIATAEVPGGDYDHIAFRVAPAGTLEPGNASEDDVALMADAGYAVYVAGSATKGGDTIAFAWGFTGGTAYGECEGTARVDGGAHQTVLTIHVDHLFYDDLFSEEPNVAFDLIAAADAAGDGNGDVTPEELAAVDLATEERYQVGSTGITDLWSFIDYQTATLGHIDGEGHCGEAVRE
jgi:hypothetical protein